MAGNEGFTLFEVLVVLVLITLLYSIFIYDFGGAERRIAEKIDLQQLASDLQALRDESLRRDGDYRCLFFPDERDYLLQMEDTVLNRRLKTLVYVGQEELEITFFRFQPVAGEIVFKTPQDREYRLRPDGLGYFEVIQE